MSEEKPHILLVEDEMHLARGICFNLETDGYRISHVERGEEALERLQYERFDLIILDIMLPRRDGWEILAELRRSGMRVPVICLTARDSVEDRVRGLELGAEDYVVKPFAFAELLARVRAALRRGGTADAAVVRVADLEVDFLTQARRARDGRSTSPPASSRSWACWRAAPGTPWNRARCARASGACRATPPRA